MSNENKKTALEKIKSEVNFPLKYDEHSQFFLDADGKPIAELRGWGWIQYLFKSEAEAAFAQDSWGNLIAEALNSLQEKENICPVCKSSDIGTDKIGDRHCFDCGADIKSPSPSVEEPLLQKPIVKQTEESLTKEASGEEEERFYCKDALFQGETGRCSIQCVSCENEVDNHLNSKQ